jgi:alpha-ketoglutarate-dependent taurine dioxygenase
MRPTPARSLDLGLLEDQGYLVWRDLDVAHIEDVVGDLGTMLGKEHAVATLAADRAPSLPAHTEAIYKPRPLRYFVLGCIQPASRGGETTIYDARHAASLVLSDQPSLSVARILYASSFGGESAAHDLIVKRHLDSPPVPVLVFRQEVPANTVLYLPAGWTEKALYAYVDRVLEQSVVTEHRWQAGDILVVDNAVTLHGRRSFAGAREMVRLRVEDVRCE